MEGISQIDGNSGFGVTFGNITNIFIILSDTKRNGKWTDHFQAALQAPEGLLQLLRQSFPVLLRHRDDKYDQVTLSEIFGLGEHLMHFLNRMSENDFRRFFQHTVGVGIQMIGEIFLNVINVYDRSQTTISKIPAIKSCTIVDLHISLYVIGQKIFQK